MAKDLAVVLSSGGLNSVVAASLACQKYRPVLLHAGTVGGSASGTPSAPRVAFDRQVAHFRPVREHVLDTPLLGSIGKSGRDLATAAGSDPRVSVDVRPRLVELLPLIGAAVRIATHHSAAAVYVGLSVGTQPDPLAAGVEYLQIWNELVQMPCGLGALEVVAPLLELETWQTVDLGLNVRAPLELGWSCESDDATTPCGACRGCRARAEAFDRLGKVDPLRG